jgi:ribosomal protein S18 acetylase RimI-like enzyme
MSQKNCEDVTIRAVDLNYLDDLLALEMACFDGDRINRRNMRNLLRSPSALCVAAFKGSILIGSMVNLFRSNSNKVRIYSLAVAESARGLGVGAQLLQWAEQESIRRNCTSMRLEVKQTNLNAVRLYERIGFTKTAEIPAFYEDGSDAMIYYKELNLHT